MNCLFTTQQVEELTSLSRSTIWRLAKAGQFPDKVSISPGRKAYLREDIEAWVKAKSKEHGEQKND